MTAQRGDFERPTPAPGARGAVSPIPRYVGPLCGICGVLFGFGGIQTLLVAAGPSGLPLWLPLAALVVGLTGWAWCVWRSSYRTRLWLYRRSLR